MSTKPNTPHEIVRIIRIIEYKGPRDWVEYSVQRAVHGTKIFDDTKSITAVTLGDFPEILTPKDSK